jgi:small conductance mechanosensitive channel
VTRVLPVKGVLLLFICAMGGDGALAQPQGNEQITDPASVIEVVPGESTDPSIQTRIEHIYEQIDALANVDVSVQEGVVTLSGQVSNDAQAQKAVALARRLQGTVTVEDEIERTLDIEGNVVPVLDQSVSKLKRWAKAWPLVVVSLLVFVLIAGAGYGLAKWGALWTRVAPNSFLAELMAQAVRVTFLVLGLVLALNLIGATTLMGTILGGAGVLGLTVGFAVRDAMENYVSSIMLSLRQPFRANDHVLINDREGKVVRLTSRATILMTLDGNHLRIPNSTVYKAVILNYTRNPERRFDFELGTDAADDPVAAMATGLEALRELEHVLGDPGPDAIIKTVGDSNIVITFMAWIDQTRSDFGKVRSLAIKVTKDALEQRGFTLPEPLYRVRLDEHGLRLAEPALQSGAAAAEPVVDRKQAADAASPEAVLDVSPDTHIEAMVNDERSQSGEDDLLDSARPVE